MRKIGANNTSSSINHTEDVPQSSAIDDVSSKLKRIRENAFSSNECNVDSCDLHNNPKRIKIELNTGIDQQDKKRPALINAVLEGNEEKVKALININVQDEEGKTLLMYAAENNNEKIVKMLIDAGADLDVQDEAGETALIHAIKNKNKEIVKMLINAGAGLDVQDEAGKTALIHAIKNKNKEIAKILINAGADLKVYDKEGKEPLVHAVDIEDKKIIEMIINVDSNSDINWALTYAAEHKCSEKIVKKLIKMGADVNEQAIMDGYLPVLSRTIKNWYSKEVIERIINAGADINLVGGYPGKTPLSMAIKKKRKDITEILIKNGADIFAQDKEKAVILLKDLQAGETDSIYFLLESLKEIIKEDILNQKIFLEIAKLLQIVSQTLIYKSKCDKDLTEANSITWKNVESKITHILNLMAHDIDFSLLDRNKLIDIEYMKSISLPYLDLKNRECESTQNNMYTALNKNKFTDINFIFS